MATTAVFLPGESQGREAWWTAIYGVTHSQTRLKQLSSSRYTQNVSFLPVFVFWVFLFFGFFFLFIFIN